MIKLALWVYLEAKPGKEKELELFLQKGLASGAGGNRDNDLVCYSSGRFEIWYF